MAERESSPDRAAFVLLAGSLLSVWGIALSNGLLALAVLRSWWRLGLPLGRPAAWSESKLRALWPVAVYAVLLVASVAGSYDPRNSSSELSELFSLAVLPLALLLIRSEARARRIVDLLLLMILLLAVHGLWQEFFTDRGPHHARIAGLFSHYMTLSGVLVLGLCLLAGRLVTRPQAPEARGKAGIRMLLATGPWLALLVLSATLYLTWTRHAWLAALVALGVAMWIGSRRWLPVYCAAVLIVGLLIASFSPSGWQRMRSIFDLGNPSNYDRVCMLYAGMTMVAERPLLGIGPAMVAQRYAIYSHPTAPRKDAMHLHNTFVHVAAERGLLSLGAYCWLMLSSLRLAAVRYRQGGRDGPRADLYLGVVIAIVAYNFSGLFEANWQDTEVQRLMLFLLAVPYCLEDDSSEQVAPTASLRSVSTGGRV